MICEKRMNEATEILMNEATGILDRFVSIDDSYLNCPTLDDYYYFQGRGVKFKKPNFKESNRPQFDTFNKFNTLKNKPNDKSYLRNKKGRTFEDCYKNKVLSAEQYECKKMLNNAINVLFANSKKLRHFVLDEGEILVKTLVESLGYSDEFTNTFVSDLIPELSKDSSFQSLSESDKIDVLRNCTEFGLEHYQSKLMSGLPCKSDELIMTVVCSTANDNDDTEVSLLGYFYHAPNCHTPARSYLILSYCGLSIAHENITDDILASCNSSVAGFSLENMRNVLQPLVSKMLCDFKAEEADEDIDEEEIFRGKSESDRADEILTNLNYCDLKVPEMDEPDANAIKESLKHKNAIQLASVFPDWQLELISWGNLLSDNVITSYIDEYSKNILLTPSFRREALNYAKHEASRLTSEKLITGSSFVDEFGSW